MAPSSPSSDVPTGGDEDAGHAVPESLSKPVVAGLKWKLFAQLIREGSRFGIAVLLARLLTPAEWGVASIALAFGALLTMIADLALPYALIQRPRITEADRSTMFWTAAALGVAGTLVGVALSGPASDVFDEPQLQSLFAVLCIGITIASLEKVPGSLLVRDFRFRALELRQIAAALVGAAASLVLALTGAGAWAIIGGSLATTTASCALLWYVTKWRPRFTFSRGSFRRLTSFGSTTLGSLLLTYVQQYADRLLIGRNLGASAAGTYVLAYNLMFIPIVNITGPLQAVLFSVFSRIQDDPERIAAGWLRGRRLTVALMAPAFMTLFVVGPQLVPLVFGPQWEDSIPVLELLCLSGVGYALAADNNVLLLARNKAGTLLRITGFATAVILAAIVIGLEWGIVGVAAGLAVAQWSLFLPTTFATARAGSVGFAQAVGASTVSLPFVAIGTAAALAIRISLLSVGAPDLVVIALAATALLTVYPAASYVGSSSLRSEMNAAWARAERWLAERRGRRTESPAR